jgi:hypothetical protein
LHKWECASDNAAVDGRNRIGPGGDGDAAAAAAADADADAAEADVDADAENDDYFDAAVVDFDEEQARLSLPPHRLPLSMPPFLPLMKREEK